MIYKGDIRMLKWGLIPNQPTFVISVNQEVGLKKSLKVLQIQQGLLEDEETIVFHVECCLKGSPTQYLAGETIKGTPDGPAFIWKTYTKMPDEIEYFIPEGEHNHKKI